MPTQNDLMQDPLGLPPLCIYFMQPAPPSHPQLANKQPFALALTAVRSAPDADAFPNEPCKPAVQTPSPMAALTETSLCVEWVGSRPWGNQEK